LRAVFRTSSEVREPWTLSEQLDGRFEYVFVQAASNPRYESRLCVGLSTSALPGFVGCPMDVGEAKDALKEFANTFVGMIMDIQALRDVCGVLTQMSPAEAVGGAFFPRAPGINGKLWVGDHAMYLGYCMSVSAATGMDPEYEALVDLA